MFGHKKKLEDALLANGGTVAWATVLEGKETWSSASGNRYGMPTGITEHMRLKLRVQPESEPPFETELSQAFKGAVPFTGWQCKVVFDPTDRSRIAVIEDSIAPPGITHEQAERSAAHRAEAMEAISSGRLAEYIEERKAQAMRGEFGGTMFVGGQMVSGQSQSKPDIVDQLTKLADLRERGALTDAEFQAQKAKLLAEN